MKKWSNSNRGIIIEQSLDMISEKRPKLVTSASIEPSNNGLPYVFIYPGGISETSKIIYIPDTNVMLKLADDISKDNELKDKIDTTELARKIYQKHIQLIQNILSENELKVDNVIIYFSPIMWEEFLQNLSSLPKGPIYHLATLYKISETLTIRLEQFSKFIGHTDSREEEKMKLSLLSLYIFIGKMAPSIIHPRYLEELVQEYKCSKKIKSIAKQIQIEHQQSYDKMAGKKGDKLGLGEFLRSGFDTYLMLLIALREILRNLSAANSSDDLLKLGKGIIRKSVDKYDAEQVSEFENSDDKDYKIIHDRYDSKKIRVYPYYLFRYPVLIATYDRPLYHFLSSIKSDKI